MARTAAMTMATRSQGNQPGLRPSRTQAQAAVSAIAADIVARANQVWRIRHRP